MINYHATILSVDADFDECSLLEMKRFELFEGFAKIVRHTWRVFPPLADAPVSQQ